MKQSVSSEKMLGPVGAMRTEGVSCFKGIGNQLCVEIPRDKEGKSWADFADESFQVGVVGSVVGCGVAAGGVCDDDGESKSLKTWYVDKHRPGGCCAAML